MAKYFIYILQGSKNRRYVGYTNCLQRRLAEHNSGKTKSTKAFRPWKIIYIEEFDDLENVIKREKYLKSGIGREFIAEKLEHIMPT